MSKINKAVLDTHAFIWLMQGSKELTGDSIKTIESYGHNHALYLSAISLWEVAMLEKKRKNYITSALSSMVKPGFGSSWSYRPSNPKTPKFPK